MRRGSFGPARLLTAVALAGCVGAPAATSGQSPATSSGLAPGVRVYVANQDDATVSIFDAGTLEPVTTVDLEALGFSSNAKPHHIVVEPDGSFWYLSLIGENRILKLDRDNRIVGQTEFDVPGMLALDVDSDRLFVGRSMSAVNPPQRIGVIDRPSMTIEEVPVLYPRPHALATHPGGDLVYSASLAENTMAVVDPVQGDVALRSIPPPGANGEGRGVHTVVQFAISPDGSWMVGTGELSGMLLVFDLSDPARPELAKQVPVNGRPWHPVFSPDGRRVWFANKGANTVTVVDTRTWTVADVVEGEGLAEPHGSAISPDGRFVFVSSNNLKGEYAAAPGTLTVIDAASHEIVRVLAVGANAAGVGTRAR